MAGEQACRFQLTAISSLEPARVVGLPRPHATSSGIKALGQACSGHTFYASRNTPITRNSDKL